MDGPFRNCNRITLGTRGTLTRKMASFRQSKNFILLQGSGEGWG